MKIDIRQHPTKKDKAEITILSDPIKVISLEGQQLTLEWEGRRWKTTIPHCLGILPEEDQIKKAFIETVNRSLRQVGEELRNCPICQQDFPLSGKGRQRIYCSDKCRMRASRKRRKE